MMYLLFYEAILWDLRDNLRLRYGVCSVILSRPGLGTRIMYQCWSFLLRRRSLGVVVGGGVVIRGCRDHEK